MTLCITRFKVYNAQCHGLIDIAGYISFTQALSQSSTQNSTRCNSTHSTGKLKRYTTNCVPYVCVCCVCVSVQVPAEDTHQGTVKLSFQSRKPNIKN